MHYHTDWECECVECGESLVKSIEYVYSANQPIMQTQWPGIILLTKICSELTHREFCKHQIQKFKSIAKFNDVILKDVSTPRP